VTDGGVLVRGRGVDSVTADINMSTYSVTFQESVEGCAWSVTPTPGNGSPKVAIARSEPTDFGHTVLVRTFLPFTSAIPDPSGFHLVVTC
jgi:hypothetical protein